MQRHGRSCLPPLCAVLVAVLGACADAQVGWRPVASPEPREGHCGAWHPGTQRLILFGGDAAHGQLDDSWAWDGRLWTRLPTAAAPSPRTRAPMGTDPITGQIIGAPDTCVGGETADPCGGRRLAFADRSSAT